ncbi:MAG: FGGY family carbohydrate kinase [Cyclobacteriaceae bacterium]|nr:FGGY family carbohydrate kinase [Cyclobacteriaceae bacterium]
MKGQPVTLIFDIGKTNKKWFLFDPDYSIVEQEIVRFDEIPDEDGFPSDNLPAIADWIRACAEKLLSDDRYVVQALNFSTYGASLVHLDRTGRYLPPFYNYLKPFPDWLAKSFFSQCLSRHAFELTTASPWMGLLNSGLQLYYLKHAKPEKLAQLALSLHFPQYLSSLFTGHFYAEHTSIGCHTGLWDFEKKGYAGWLETEGLTRYLPPAGRATHIHNAHWQGRQLRVGVGVHDSSAALVPYLQAIDTPFALISTGTWSICMNPFNHQPLTEDELHRDCLHFLAPTGNTVKASRLFLGRHLEQQLHTLARSFGVDVGHFHQIRWRPFQSRRAGSADFWFDHGPLQPERFGVRNGSGMDRSHFDSYEDAYFHLMDELTDLQLASLQLVLGNSPVKKVFIDGGFGENEVFVQLIASKRPDLEIFSAENAQGSALGAALLVSGQPLPTDFMIKNYRLKSYRKS